MSSGIDIALPDAREAVLGGNRIVPVMSPNTELGKFRVPLPAYDENYPLPYVVLHGNLCWGITAGTNVPHHIGKGVFPPVVIAYTNSAPIYASMSALSFEAALRTRSHQMQICPLRQYRAFQFTARKDAELVWDGARPMDFGALESAIAAGSYYRLVFEAQDGIVFSLGVDISMFFSGERALTVNTHPFFVPEYFADPQRFVDVLQHHLPELLEEQESPELALKREMGVTGMFYSLRNDGTYYGIEEIRTGKPKSWRQARLYAH